MDKIVENGMLYDFYGTMLTGHQQEIMEMAVYRDLSLSEIAQAEGISRQAVSDLLRRASAEMQRYEDHLHLVERFRRVGVILDDIGEKAGAGESVPSSFLLQAVASIRKEL